MFKPKYDFEWNMLGIYNYNREGRLACYFKYLNENLDKEGDLVEAGVFRGSSLLSVALFLKEKGSKKILYAYDSFCGFPPIYHKMDNIKNYKKLYETGLIKRKHYEQIKTSLEIKKIISSERENTASVISSSGDFSNTSLGLIKKKIEFLGLDNIILVDGPFDETMVPVDDNYPEKILAGIIDCDLYNSYLTSLNYFWPKLECEGALFLDEYFSLKFPGAKIAVDEFLLNNYGKLIRAQNDECEFERWLLIKYK